MKAVISSTYDDKYLFFLPIVTWCWNKLGVDVICFIPESNGVFVVEKGNKDVLVINADSKFGLVVSVLKSLNLKFEFKPFKCPENKEATYSQCARLYAACLDLPEDEVLVTGDVDMAVFQIPANVSGTFSVFGYDLVPEGQMPMCYLTASVKQWRETFDIGDKTYQECLDGMLGHEEMENMRGNLWSRDQETAYNKINNRFAYTAIKRAKPGTQFATNRYDRDDAFLLDRLSPDTIDYHMPRPGYEENNFNQILTVLQYHFPQDDFTWLREYRDKYLELL